MFVMLVISGQICCLCTSLFVCVWFWFPVDRGWVDDCVTLFFHNTEFIHFAGIPPMLSSCVPSFIEKVDLVSSAFMLPALRTG